MLCSGKVRQTKYNLALAVALGADLDSVLVESRDTAKACIQHLKNHRSFAFRVKLCLEMCLSRQLPLNFLPLDSITAKPLREDLRRLGGSARLAIDALNFDRRYEKGFLFVCGNAVVCDTLEEAKHLAYRQQVSPFHPILVPLSRSCLDWRQSGDPRWDNDTQDGLHDWRHVPKHGIESSHVCCHGRDVEI